MKRAIVSVLATLALLSALVPLTAWQNTPTLGVLPDSGPALPATCVVGQIYFKTTATTGLNQCATANTWTAIGGSGSGTVNAGTANQIAIYPASAAAVSGDSLLTDDGTTHTYTGSGGILASGAGGLKAGANGGSAGVLTLNGSTSGAATLTAPAVAGTATNPITTANNIEVTTTGSGNGFCIGATNNCFAASASANLTLSPGGANATFIDANRFLMQGSQWMLPNARNIGFVTTNFTTAANTNLQTITGLAFTMLATANNYTFHCALSYSQATATAAVAFGIQAATNSPTNIFATGVQQITVGPPATSVAGTLATLTTTTATNIVSGTPGATATNYVVMLDGTLELAASANTINFMVSTATSGDAVTVLRGSYCNVW